MGDDLDKYVSQRDQREPGFADKVAAAERRAEKRTELGAMLKARRGRLSQTVVAARMGTSPSIVRRLEAGEDVRISTIEKYVEAIGADLKISVG